MKWALGLLAPLLGGCFLLPPAEGENGTVLLGVRVHYVMTSSAAFDFCPADRVGCSVPLGGVCFVQIDRAYFDNGTAWQKVNLVAHEVGHCLDLRRLGLSSGGFRDEGKRWGAYYANPSEGFAEAYARTYIDRCGLDLDSLGWMNRRGTCALPDPKTVTPRLIESLGL